MGATINLCGCDMASDSVIIGTAAHLATGGLCGAICLKCRVGYSHGIILDLDTIKVDAETISALSKDRYTVHTDDFKIVMGSAK